MALFKDDVAVPLDYGADWSERHMYGDELVGLVESAFGPIRIAFVLRYADFLGQGHAVLTREEYESHLRVGIRSWLIYQRYERDPDGGGDRGREYGHAAVAYAQKIGYQQGDPIFATADRPAGEFDLDVAEAFFAAFAEVVRAAGYLAGGYGFWDVIYRLQEHHVVDVLWLCGAQSRWREGIHLYQFNNGRIFPGEPPVPTDLCMQFEPIGTQDVTPPLTPETLEETMIERTLPATPDVAVFTLPVPTGRRYRLQIIPTGEEVELAAIYNWGAKPQNGKGGNPVINAPIVLEPQEVGVYELPEGTGKADIAYASGTPVLVLLDPIL